jgi:hypothetical protein
MSLRGLPVLLLVSLLALGLAACSDDEHVTGPFEEKGESPEVQDLGSISGRVVNAAGQPVPFAQVTAGDRSGFADQDGRFFLANLPLDLEIAYFTKDARTSTNFRALSLTAGGEINFPGIALLPMERGAVFFADEGAEAAVGGLGSGATFADSSFASADTLYLERVAAYLAVSTVGDASFAAAFPGDFVGQRDDGTEVPLEGLGVIWTFIDSQAGELQLAEGRRVRYRLGLDPGGATPLPPVATAWSLDLETGRWSEVGPSDLDGAVYEIEVASIAPVCWAVEATDQCEVAGLVQDDAGRPLADARVECRDLGGRFRQATFTGDDGSFSLMASRADSVLVKPYFGSIEGEGVVVDTRTDCPALLDEPLLITLPDFRIDLAWQDGYGDLDAYFSVAGEWLVSYVDRRSLESAPYAMLESDERAGGAPETMVGRRWYDGVSEYWVHDYQNRSTEALRASGAVVNLVINEENWSFAVSSLAFDPAATDTSGWWHVFDVVVSGTSVSVDTVQAFAPAPDLR